MVPRAIIAVLVLCLAALPVLAQSEKAPAPAKGQKKDQPAASAKTAPKAGSTEDPVVARVNGTPIFRSDLETLRSTLPPQAQQQAPQELYNRLLDQLIALQLVSQNARKARLDQEPRVKKMIALADEQILQDAFLDGIMRSEITEAKLRVEYDKYVKSAPSREEVHARHILVPTEAEAKELIEQLKKGADFAKLATDKTTDPAGKAAGGDLGYFSQTDMVPEFAAAAFALKPGEFSQTPVKTQFGWHVIKVEDRRQAKPEPYEKMAPQIARQMAQVIYNQKLKELAGAGKVEVFNADGSTPTANAAPPAQSAVAPAQPASVPSGQPGLLPLQNGNPDGPPPNSGPPTMAPGTQNLGK